MGVGSLSMIVPMYVAECAPPELRGLLIGMQQFAIEFGIMVSFWIVCITSFHQETPCTDLGRTMAPITSEAPVLRNQMLPGSFHWLFSWLLLWSCSLE